MELGLQGSEGASRGVGQACNSELLALSFGA